jgi:hypothetical protein
MIKLKVGGALNKHARDSNSYNSIRITRPCQLDERAFSKYKYPCIWGDYLTVSKLFRFWLILHWPNLFLCCAIPRAFGPPMALLTPLWAQRASSMSLYSFPPPHLRWGG